MTPTDSNKDSIATSGESFSKRTRRHTTRYLQLGLGPEQPLRIGGHLVGHVARVTGRKNPRVADVQRGDIGRVLGPSDCSSGISRIMIKRKSPR
jgi:hypothetical protein